MKTLRHGLMVVLTALALLTTVRPTLFAQAGTNPNNLNSLDRRLIQYAQVTLTNAQVLTLGSASGAVTVIPAKGAGTVTEVITGNIAFKYTATYSAGSNLKLWYTNRYTGPAASSSVTVANLLTGVSASTFQNFTGTPDQEVLAGAVNKAVVVQGTTPTAFTGGDASNTVTIRVAYRVHNTGF